MYHWIASAHYHRCHKHAQTASVRLRIAAVSVLPAANSHLLGPHRQGTTCPMHPLAPAHPDWKTHTPAHSAAAARYCQRRYHRARPTVPCSRCTFLSGHRLESPERLHRATAVTKLFRMTHHRPMHALARGRGCQFATKTVAIKSGYSASQCSADRVPSNLAAVFLWLPK